MKMKMGKWKEEEEGWQEEEGSEDKDAIRGRGRRSI
jgi:hypothetical protein